MNIVILGSGAMGTLCALLLQESPGRRVSLWGRSREHVADIARRRENVRLLPGAPLPAEIEITSEFDVARTADAVVVAIPTQFLRETLAPFRALLPAGAPVISVVKGIDAATFQRPSKIIQDVLGPRPLAVLSGPCHAEEAARRLPASVAAASDDAAWAGRVQELFTTDRFRVYTNPDVAGVELAGALKNVIAIAAGISDGLGYGDNAKAALLTRGIVEMTRFGVALGARQETFWGLAGIGDLITTCVSPHGRNRRVGVQLGQGRSLEDISAEMPGVAEGVRTCPAVVGLAAQRGIDMPITREVFAVLFEGRSPSEATDRLMQRPPRCE